VSASGETDLNRHFSSFIPFRCVIFCRTLER
jgi:hypothetical protein